MSFVTRKNVFALLSLVSVLVIFSLSLVSAASYADICEHPQAVVLNLNSNPLDVLGLNCYSGVLPDGRTGSQIIKDYAWINLPSDGGYKTFANVVRGNSGQCQEHEEFYLRTDAGQNSIVSQDDSNACAQTSRIEDMGKLYLEEGNNRIWMIHNYECNPSSNAAHSVEITKLCLIKNSVPLVTCTQNTDCNDNNQSTADECVFPGTYKSYCRNTQINCVQDSDCGSTGFIGLPFCSQNNVFQNFQKSTCNNAGTPQSYCSSNVDSKLKQSCSLGCSNGQCINQPPVITCNTNADCNDNNQSTEDVCNLPGTEQSYCTNNPINPPLTCSDSDNGLNYTVKGTVEGFWIGSPFTDSDHYRTPVQVGEYFCLNDSEKELYPGFTVGLKYTDCDYACSEGVCIPRPQGEQINVTITNPVNNAVLNSTSVFLQYIIQGNAQACWYSLNLGLNVSLPGCQNKQITVPQGNNIITVFANNSLGELFKDTNAFSIVLPSNQTDDDANNTDDDDELNDKRKNKRATIIDLGPRTTQSNVSLAYDYDSSPLNLSMKSQKSSTGLGFWAIVFIIGIVILLIILLVLMLA